MTSSASCSVLSKRATNRITSWPRRAKCAVTASLSIAVFGHDGARVGAMTVSGPIERIRRADLRTLASRLADASHQLSLVLGAQLPREVGAPRIISLPSAEAGSA